MTQSSNSRNIGNSSFGSSTSDVTKDDTKPKPTKKGILSLASPVDYLLLVLGSLASIIHGAGFSILGIVLGGMTTVFLKAQNSDFVLGENMSDPNGLPQLTQDEFNREVKKYCLYYLLLGVAMFVTSYIQIASFESYAEK
ncbi:unnamed protein product, partial [Cylicostephanus goldi]